MFKKVTSGLFVAAMCASTLSAAITFDRVSDVEAQPVSSLKVHDGQFGEIERGALSVVSVLKKDGKIDHKDLHTLMFAGAHQVVLFHDGKVLSEAQNKAIQVFNHAVKKNFVVVYHAEGIGQLSPEKQEKFLKYRCVWGVKGENRGHFIRGKKNSGHIVVLDITTETVVPFTQDDGGKVAEEFKKDMVTELLSKGKKDDILHIENNKIFLAGFQVYPSAVKEGVESYRAAVESAYSELEEELNVSSEEYEKVQAEVEIAKVSQYEGEANSSKSTVEVLRKKVAEETEKVVKTKNLRKKMVAQKELDVLKKKLADEEKKQAIVGTSLENAKKLQEEKAAVETKEETDENDPTKEFYTEG